MEKKFAQFVFQFLAEMGVDANAVVSAFAEQQGFKGLRQERDLRDKLAQLGVTVSPVTGLTAAVSPDGVSTLTAAGKVGK